MAAFDPLKLRAALGCFATGVTVVSTVDASGRPRGLTANAFCSVSLDPPLILVCINKSADSHRHLRHSGKFGISLLSEGQEPLARRFATPDPAKYEDVPLAWGHNGAPLIQGALAHLECRLTDTYEGGDHTIYIGEVERFEIHGGRPLVFFGGRYRSLDPD